MPDTFIGQLFTWLGVPAPASGPTGVGGQFITPEPYCFIIDLDGSPGASSYLKFQLMPEVISENKSANYDRVPIIGRSLPLLAYAHSNSRQMNLSLEFVALSGSSGYTPDWVIQQVRWLEAKVYPDYKEGWAYPPHRLLISVGEALSMQCVMTSVNTSWIKPWQTSGGAAKAFKAQVDCSFEECGANDDIGHPFGHDDALKGDNQALWATTPGSGWTPLPDFV